MPSQQIMLYWGDAGKAEVLGAEGEGRVAHSSWG